MALDEAKMNNLLGQMLSDLGGAASVAMVRMGDALGLYRTMNENGPMTCEDLAVAAGVQVRYLREWLSHQAASNYVEYDPATNKFSLPSEQASPFAIEDSPTIMLGAFDAVASFAEGQSHVQQAFRNGGGVAWEISAHASSARLPVSFVQAICTISFLTGCRPSTVWSRS